MRPLMPASARALQRLECDDLERERDFRARAPHDARRQRDEARGEPDDDPDLLERDADRERGLVAVGDGAQGAANARLLEEQRERRHHQRGDDRRGNIDLLQRHEAAGELHVDRALGQAELGRDHYLGIAAEHELAEADEKIGESEGCHEQDNVGLVDQRSEHQPLDADREPEHHRDGDGEREVGRNAVLVQPDQCQRREHDHDALREIENNTEQMTKINKSIIDANIVLRNLQRNQLELEDAINVKMITISIDETQAVPLRKTIRIQNF